MQEARRAFSPVALHKGQRRVRLNSLHRHMRRILKDSNASPVLENVLAYAALHETQSLAAERLASPESREVLTGSRVGRELADVFRWRRLTLAWFGALPAPKKSSRRITRCELSEGSYDVASL